MREFVSNGTSWTKEIPFGHFYLERLNMCSTLKSVLGIDSHRADYQVTEMTLDSVSKAHQYFTTAALCCEQLN